MMDLSEGVDEECEGSIEGMLGQRSVRLNDQFRMVFELDEQTDPQTVTIFSIEDYH
jgi:plasmid maintenance system killer protein